jgi:hypothetical protein
MVVDPSIRPGMSHIQLVMVDFSTSRIRRGTNRGQERVAELGQQRPPTDKIGICPLRTRLSTMP